MTVRRHPRPKASCLRALAEPDEAAWVAALPTSPEESLGSHPTDSTLTYHSGRSGGVHFIYTGHGGAPRGRRVDLDRYHQRVARALGQDQGAQRLDIAELKEMLDAFDAIPEAGGHD